MLKVKPHKISACRSAENFGTVQGYSTGVSGSVVSFFSFVKPHNISGVRATSWSVFVDSLALDVCSSLSVFRIATGEEITALVVVVEVCRGTP